VSSVLKINVSHVKSVSETGRSNHTGKLHRTTGKDRSRTPNKSRTGHMAKHVLYRVVTIIINEEIGNKETDN
jgi:hypothetical protein